jgi:raffinose/stachyose/melibiose transport system permease protein
VNSVVVTGLGIVLNLVIMSMAAYVLARFEFRYRKLIRSIFALRLLIPSAALLLPLFMSVKAMGLYDTLGGLILVTPPLAFPLRYLSCRATF